ncbi:winged helix-turn-helix transcriptional regulator [[Eubacterium] cellulosolvens]
MAGELCSVEIELQNEVEIDQLDALTRVTNSSISSLSFFVPLYSKLNSSDIVSNNSRENILNLITSTPGITLGSITRKLKLRNGTAMHHLRILEREGYIKSKKTGKFRRYYILGTKASGFNEIQDRIISKVQEEPGISQSEIARELSLSRQLVNYHMQDLVTSDVIYLEKLGNRSYCFIMT